MKAPEQPIIEKTLNNEASAEEARQVVRWLGTPDGQDWLSERMDRDSDRIVAGMEESFLDHPVPSEQMYEQIMKKVRQMKARRFMLSAAAIVIPLLLIAGLYMELNSRVDLFARAEYDEVIVPRGEQMQILFQDGSRVVLNSESRLRYPRKFGMKERRVELEGEGWFEVARKRNRPFIVDLDDLDVQVLGTTFDVKAYPNEENISVSLETGLIELSNSILNSLSVKPGEKVIYHRASGRFRIIQEKNIEALSSWRENMLLFNDAPLSEVLAALTRTFDVTFRVDDKAALKYHYTLNTNNRDLLQVIAELEKIAPVRFVKEGEGYVIVVEKQ